MLPVLGPRRGHRGWGRGIFSGIRILFAAQDRHSPRRGVRCRTCRDRQRQYTHSGQQLKRLHVVSFFIVAPACPVQPFFRSGRVALRVALMFPRPGGPKQHTRRMPRAQRMRLASQFAARVVAAEASLGSLEVGKENGPARGPSFSGWWRWAESNRRPEMLHIRDYMLSLVIVLSPRRH